MMYRRSKQIRLLLITIMLTIVSFNFYIRKFPETICPLLTPHWSTYRATKSNIRSLYDIPKVTKNADSIAKAGDETIHSIVWNKQPEWISVETFHTSLQSCVYRNCRISNDTNNLKIHSALVFALTEGMEQKPPLLPTERPTGQIWAFYYLESTLNMFRYPGELSDAWRSTMNWSMTYRLDSDIVVPYGTLKTRRLPPDRDYHNIYTRKSKCAAWFVSNCGDDSGRYKFVLDLRKLGIPVDIYGACGEMGVQNRSYLIDILNKDYMFYFAFENSLCPDYITEKLFHNFNLDVVLVVRGGADYNRLIPSNVVIDASDFTSARALADYLIRVGSSEQLYSFYLTEKDRYIYTGDQNEYSYCKLCEMLNNKEEYVNVYENVNEYIFDRDHTCKECRQPTPLYWVGNIVPYIIVPLICLCLSFALPLLSLFFPVLIRIQTVRHL